MSSDWQPPRKPLFGIALMPPGASAGASQPFRAASLRGTPPEGAVPGEAPPPSTCRSESSGWTVVAISPAVPVCVAVVAASDRDLWPERWLHPAEKRAVASLAPHARQRSLAVLTAARRALEQALGLPAPAAACVDLSPLLHGVQSLRLGGWTLQRVPAPRDCFVFAAAPGWGWSYLLLPPDAAPPSAERS